MWQRSDRDRQRWNYQVYRKMGYGPKLARKMRNRSPETTLVHIHDEVRRQYEAKIKHPMRVKDFPRVPQSLISKGRRGEFLKFLRTDLGMSKKEASRYARLGLEKQLVMKARVDGFIRYVRDIDIADGVKPRIRKQILTGIQEHMRGRTTDDFFEALRWYYRNVIGVPAE